MLFPDSKRQEFNLKDGKITFVPNFLPPTQADAYLKHFKEDTPWKQEHIRLFGKQVAMPRLTCWYGDPGSEYTYSGLTQEPLEWTPALLEIKEALERPFMFSFNSVLLNYYRSGNDSMGWHSDDEPELGIDPVIASVNLGATRTFRLRHRKHKELQQDFLLEHGSLLLMHGALQHHWVHAVPKRKTQPGERINLTFRKIIVA